ncbi:hypothetical protein GQX73_g10905 [Xylaria multiplex]|uniref:Uncharacterized protein n=1 Tax=Xylaria multiplex TaxID=323545 RepID=A0A7C8IFZ5_9PEZI|nr:hypothetical protein GQX73_g10905 [Xylaria multiplex]
MVFFRLATKATITWLMIQMLYTAHAGVFAAGMLLCSIFGNEIRLCQPSIDLFLFFGTAVVSKRMESLPGGHELTFDAYILALAAFYFIAGDRFRASLLGTWLPYFYMDSDRGKCGVYISLAAVVPMFPHLRRVVWPLTSAMLSYNIRIAFSKICVYAIEAIKSVTPLSPTLSHLPPPPRPPMLSLSAIVTTVDIAPAKEPRANMIDSSTQTEPHTKANTTRYIVTGNGIFSAPLDLPPMKRLEPSRIRKQRLRDLARRGPATIPARVPSPPAWPSKSVIFTPISASASPAPVPEPLASPSPDVVDPTPLPPSMPGPLTVSLPILGSVAKPPGIPATPTLISSPASPSPLVEVMEASTVAFVPEPVSELLILTTESAPISILASPNFSPQPTLPSATAPSPPSPVTLSLSAALSLAPIPDIPCLVPAPVHSSPTLTALPSPISASVPFETSPLYAPSSNPILVPSLPIAFPLLSNPVISSTFAFEPEPEIVSNLLSFPPVLPSTLDVSASSYFDIPIIASVDPMEMDSEGAFIALLVDNGDDIDMGEPIQEGANPGADLTNLDCTQDPNISDIESEDEGGLENLFTDEEIASNEQFINSNVEPNHKQSFMDGDLEVVYESFSNNNDRPLEFEYPPLDQEMADSPSVVADDMQGVISTVSVPSTVENINDSDDESEKDNEEGTDERMDDMRETDETEDLFGLMFLDSVADPKAVPVLPSLPSTPFDDKEMDENCSVFEMGELLSSLPPTPAASPAAAPTDAATDNEMDASDGQFNTSKSLDSLDTLHAATSLVTLALPAVPPLRFNSAVSALNHAKIENHLGLAPAGFDSSLGLAGTLVPTAKTAPASPAAPSTFILAVPGMSPMSTIPCTPDRPSLAPVPTSNRLPPRPPNANPPIAFDMAPNPDAPKLNSRFIMSDVPRSLEYKILALQPGYRPARKTNVDPRNKEVYIEEFQDNDGYRRKAPWQIRGLPPVDKWMLLHLEQRMNEAAEEAGKDWPSREAGIEEQTRLDLIAKKERDKALLMAKHKARLAAYERCRKKKNPGPSVFSK